MSTQRPLALLALIAALVAMPARADWQPNGNIITPFTFTETDPNLVSDGQGGVFVVLDAFFQGPLLQRFRADGSPADGWSTTARPSTPGTALRGVSRFARPIDDDHGGWFIVWIQSGESCSHGCSFNEPGRVRVQHVEATGDVSPGWPVESSVLSETMTFPYTGFEACADGEGGVWITFGGTAWRLGLDFPTAGARAIEITRTTGWTTLPALIGDGLGGAYVFWGEGDVFPRGNIRGQHLSREGVTTWETGGRVLSSSSYDLPLGSPTAISLRTGDAVIAWSGVRDLSQNGEDIFSMRISRHGERRWPTDRTVCGAIATQHQVRLASSLGDDVIAAWLDERPESGVFAQRLDARGLPRWRIDGIPISPGSDARDSPAICSDGIGGAFLAWLSPSGPFSLYATRIDARGVPTGGWPASALPLATSLTDDPFWAPASLHLQQTGRGEAMVCWQDYRIPRVAPMAGPNEVSFVMRLGPSGPAASAAPFDGTAAPAAMVSPTTPSVEFALGTAFPNPSNGDVSVRFRLPDDTPAKVELFDATGRRIVRLDVGGRPGEQSRQIALGRRLEAGIYLLRLSQGTRSATSLVTILR